jgi:hypothetical protein
MLLRIIPYHQISIQEQLQLLIIEDSLYSDFLNNFTENIKNLNLKV